MTISFFKIAPNLSLKASQIHGKGLFTTLPHKKNALLVRYDLESCNKDDPRKLFDAVVLSKKRISLAFYKSWAGYYVNHSCYPTARAVRGDDWMELRAIRDLEPNEEITYDYRSEFLNATGGYDGFSLDFDSPCKCKKEA